MDEKKFTIILVLTESGQPIRVLPEAMSDIERKEALKALEKFNYCSPIDERVER